MVSIYSPSDREACAAEPKAADLASLRSVLEGHVAVACTIAGRLNAAADIVFGSQPSLAVGSPQTDPASRNLSELVDAIGRELRRIDRALDRL